MLAVVRRCDTLRFAPESLRRSLVRFEGSDGALLGIALREHAEVLAEVGPGVFGLDGGARRLRLMVGESEGERTAAVKEVMERLRASGRIGFVSKGWRAEEYPVARAYGAPTEFAIERCCAGLIGARSYGVHANVFAVKDGRVSMWIGKRAASKPTFPGRLDQCVAGGLARGISPLDNLVKECEEEAAIPRSLALAAHSAGCVSYVVHNEFGVHPETQFVYDLEVPADFEPRNTDGEVESFQLVPLDELPALVEGDAFKPNCALVVVDFLVRRGQIDPSHPNFCELVAGMHRDLTDLEPYFLE